MQRKMIETLKNIQFQLWSSYLKIVDPINVFGHYLQKTCNKSFECTPELQSSTYKSVRK